MDILHKEQKGENPVTRVAARKAEVAIENFIDVSGSHTHAYRMRDLQLEAAAPEERVRIWECWEERNNEILQSMAYWKGYINALMAVLGYTQTNPDTDVTNTIYVLAEQAEEERRSRREQPIT